MARPRKIHFAIGRQIGSLMLLRRVRPTKGLNANLTRRWKCRCVCGIELIVPEYYMRRQPNPKEHCGCLSKTNKTLFNQEYRIWLMMHQRCYNKDHVAYHHYGGRGIEVCERWNRYGAGPVDDATIDEGEVNDAGFEAFLADVGPRPPQASRAERYWTIDRIDVDGNYEPSNVRWATPQEQADNKRPT